MRKIFLLLFLAVFYRLIFSQSTQYKFEQISIEDGLSSSTINAIVQDKKGFLWFGTENGLNRYDGYSFKVYKHKPDDSTSLSHNFVWSLAEDEEGNIWIGTDGGGLNKLNPVTEKFTHYNFNERDSTSISGDVVQYVFADRNNTLWIGTWENGLNKYNKNDDNFIRFFHNPGNPFSLSNNKIFSIYEDSRNNLWIGTDGGGASVLNRETNTFSHFIHNPDDKNSIISNNIMTVYEDSKGYIWFGAYGGGISRYDAIKKKFINYSENNSSLKGETIWKFLEDRTGNLWIGTLTNGLNIYNYEYDSFTQVKNDPYNPNSLSSDYIRTMFEDHSGILWIGTMTGGLNRIDRKPQKFFHLKHEINNANSLCDNSISAICEDRNGELWFGTYNKGLSRYNTSQNKFTHYPSNFNDKNALHGELIKKIYEDKSGRLWIGTYFSLLNIFDKKNNKFSHLNLEKITGLPEGVNNIRTIYQDNNGIFWLGINGGGLLKYDEKNNTFFRFSAADTTETKLSNDYIISICEDNDQNLWIATYGGGLNKFNKKTNTFINYFYSKEDTNSLGDNLITDILIDRKDNLWIGTYSGGLNKFDKKNNRFIRYRESDGLASSFICGIIEDNNGILWLSTDKGITKFNPEGILFKNYDFSDGIQKGEFNPGASAKTKNGWIYFGGVNGVTYFHPDSVYDNSFIPPVAFTSIKINNNELNNFNSAYADSIILSPNDYSISFEFTSLDYTQPLKNQYAYLLDGLDIDWNYAGSRRFASYTHLDPGEYIFKVKGSNNNGIWNETPLQLTVIVEPPFWATWWFRSFIILGLIGGAAYIYKNRINKLEKEKTAQEEFTKRLIASQEDERKRIASELHDSLGQDLLIIKNLALFGLKKNEKEFLTKNLQEISNTASTTIEEVRQIAYNLHPYQLDRLGLTKAIKSIITQIASLTTINFKESIENVDNIFSKEEEINIYRIIQECINNIIKHSGASEAEISILSENDKLIIKISDNGKGLELKAVENESKGFGMKNLSKRVKILNGEMDIISSPGKGTAVLIKIKQR